MYRDYWSLRRDPFSNTPDPEFFYLSPSHRDAIEWLTYGIRERKGAIVVTADPGCGKTVITRKLVRDLPPDEFEFAVIVNPSLSPVELLREILYQLGAPENPKTKGAILRELNALLLSWSRQGRHAVVVVDEMQAVRSTPTLEELRLLLNFQANDAYLLTLVMVGQPEWADRLAVLPQFEQRIAISYHVEPLDPAETTSYVRHRLATAGAGSNGEIFTDGALRLLHVATEGIPRRINAMADRCLLVASQRGIRQIDEDLVRRIAST